MTTEIQKKEPHKIQFAIVYNGHCEPHNDSSVSFFQSPSVIECIKEWKRNSNFAIKYGYRIVIMEKDKYVADVHLRGWMFDV